MASKEITQRRSARIRRQIKAVANGRPRLSVHRTSKHIYVQVIDDAQGRTLAAAAAAGALGWSGRPGRSPIWLSRAFRAEYAQMQALKLAIIDAALAVATDGLKPAAIAADWRGRSIEGAWDNPSH